MNIPEKTREQIAKLIPLFVEQIEKSVEYEHVDDLVKSLETLCKLAYPAADNMGKLVEYMADIANMAKQKDEGISSGLSH